MLSLQSAKSHLIIGIVWPFLIILGMVVNSPFKNIHNNIFQLFIFFIFIIILLNVIFIFCKKVIKSDHLLFLVLIFINNFLYIGFYRAYIYLLK